jgi:type I protein arginine methyltransferase
VNYVRTKARENSRQAPNIQSKEDFVDEEYLKPALDDDAVLFSLEDLDGEQDETGPDESQEAPVDGDIHISDTQQYLTRIAELERALERSKEAFLKERSSGDEGVPSLPRARKHRDEHDRFYFNSYSTRGAEPGLRSRLYTDTKGRHPRRNAQRYSENRRLQRLHL